MSHYEARLEADLLTIRTRLQKVGRDIEDNLRHAVRAVLEGDRALANETVLKDRAVNEHLNNLDHLCHLFVARHLPIGGHLRFISAVLRLSVALERTGDYASAISRVVLQLKEPLPESIARDIEMMGEQAIRAVGISVEGFLEGDVGKARVGLGAASQTAATYRYAYEALVAAAESDSRPIRDLFGSMLILRLLARAADQADNACELTLFAVTGTRKEAKRYRILFVDGDNALTSKLAELAAAAGYPDAACFRSAGRTPAPAFNPRLLDFCRRRGIPLPDQAVPRSLDDAMDVSRHYHVIVGLGRDPASYVENVPLRTITLQWDPAEAEASETDSQTLYLALMDRIRDLMTTLGVRDDD